MKPIALALGHSWTRIIIESAAGEGSLTHKSPRPKKHRRILDMLRAAFHWNLRSWPAFWSTETTGAAFRLQTGMSLDKAGFMTRSRASHAIDRPERPCDIRVARPSPQFSLTRATDRESTSKLDHQIANLLCNPFVNSWTTHLPKPSFDLAPASAGRTKLRKMIHPLEQQRLPLEKYAAVDLYVKSRCVRSPTHDHPAEAVGVGENKRQRREKFPLQYRLRSCSRRFPRDYSESRGTEIQVISITYGLRQDGRR